MMKIAKRASVAQSAERLPRKQVVGGSNPPRGLIFVQNIKRLREYYIFYILSGKILCWGN